MHRHAHRALATVAAAALTVLGLAAAAGPAQAASACPSVAADGTLNQVPDPFRDWSGCDLTGANLAGADLRYAKLIGSTLTGANLTAAQLDYADLTSAIVKNATFTDTAGHLGIYRDAHLEGSTFTRAALYLVNMDGAVLDGATFTNADLSGARLDSATMRTAQVRGTNFRDAQASALALTDAIIDSSNFQGATLGASTFNGATITNSNFNGTRGVGTTWADQVTSSGNTWVNATCADLRPSTAHEAGDCLRQLDEIAPAAYWPKVTGPGSGVNHWYTGPVTIAWGWYDEGAVVPTACPSTTSAPTAGTYTASCTDTAGNVGTASYAVRLDQVPPSLSGTISFVPNGTNGWYRSAPTVRYTCTDAGSGISRCPAALTPTQGARTYTVAAADVAGNVTPNATTLKLDSVKPSVGVNTSTLNSYGAQVPRCAATDATSGLASCRIATTSSSSAAYRYATATATDKAGNTAVSARVLYRATTVAAFKSAPSSVTHGYRFNVYVTAKNAKGALINVSGVRALLPVKVTSTGSGPANTTWSTYATRTSTGTYRVTFTAPKTRGYYRYAIRVGNTTITKVVRIA